jgi:hypothetical protein
MIAVAYGTVSHTGLDAASDFDDVDPAFLVDRVSHCCSPTAPSSGLLVTNRLSKVVRGHTHTHRKTGSKAIS